MARHRAFFVKQLVEPVSPPSTEASPRSVLDGAGFSPTEQPAGRGVGWRGRRRAQTTPTSPDRRAAEGGAPWLEREQQPLEVVRRNRVDEDEGGKGWATRLWAKWRKESSAVARSSRNSSKENPKLSRHKSSKAALAAAGHGGPDRGNDGSDAAERSGLAEDQEAMADAAKPVLSRSLTNFTPLQNAGKELAAAPSEGEERVPISGPLLLPNGASSGRQVSRTSLELPKGVEPILNFEAPAMAEQVSPYGELAAIDYEELVGWLLGDSLERQRKGTRIVRTVTRTSWEARLGLAEAGAIGPLLELIEGGGDIDVVENATFALCNLAVGNTRNKARIVKGGAIESLVKLLRSEVSSLQEAAVAAILTLAAGEEHHAAIGEAGGIPLITRLLTRGSDQGRCDAAHALYNLVGCEGNRTRVLLAEPIPGLLGVVQDFPDSRAGEKAVAVIYTLTAVEDGRAALAEAPAAVPALLAEIRRGSERGKEVAVSALLAGCMQSKKFCHMAFELGSVPILLELNAGASARLHARVKQLLKCLEKPGSAPIVMVSSSPETGSTSQISPISPISLCSSGPSTPHSPSFPEPHMFRRSNRSLPEFTSGNIVVQEMMKENARGVMKQIKLRANLPDNWP